MANDENFLKAKAREWAVKVVKLYKTPVPSQFESAKSKLISAAKTIKNAIEKVAGNQEYLSPMNELGLFFVPVAVVGVAGAIAAIVKWTTDYNMFMAEVDQFNKMVDGGMSPGQAADVMSKKRDSSIGFNVSTLLKVGIPIIVLGGVYLMLRGRRNGSNG